MKGMPGLFNHKIMRFAALAAAVLLCPHTALADKTNLKIGISQYPSTLNPYFDEMVAKSLVLGTALRAVTAFGPDWKPQCQLCTELPSYENGRAKRETRKDGKTGIAATYTLKDGLAWGDGVPLTTKDILFAWEVGKHPKAGVSNSEFFSKDIVSIAAKDDKTFTIHFDKEKCDFAPIGDFYPLPEHLERKIFESDPATYMSRTLYNTAPATPGLWMGPYVVAKAESGAALTVARNPSWAGKKGVFDTVTFRAVENTQALTANLLSGDIDYIAGELGLSLDQALAFEKRLKPGAYNITYKPGLTYEHIDLNLSLVPFYDVRVRQALLYGINRPLLNSALFGGKQVEASSDINPLDGVYADEVKKYPYDPAAAEKLLDEAGWKKGADGMRVNDKGAKLEIILSTTAGNRTRETVAQAIQSDWKKIGIATKIENMQARVLFGDVMRKRSYPGGVMYAWMSAPRNIPKTTLHSSMVPERDNGYGGQNYAGYKNPRMDKIIDDLDVVCGEKENVALWHDLQKLYADDLPALPLYYRSDAYIVPVWLTGLAPTGHLNPSTLWIEDWGVAP